MKILCVIDSLICGGAQRQLTFLAEGFKERGNDVSFLVYHDLPFYKPDLERTGIPVVLIREGNYLMRIIKMRRFIRRGNFDAVLSFLEAPGFICEVSGFPFRQWKLVAGERSSDPAISRSLKLMVFRWFHIFADYVVANSDFNIRQVQKVNPLLKKTKCRLIYNIVHLNAVDRKPYEGNSIKNSGMNILVAARHTFTKNLNGLIEALALLDKEELDKIHFHWYGDYITEPFNDDSFPKAKNKIKDFGLDDKITFYPATENIVMRMQECDAVALFSLYEGLPNVLCEGMALGKPVISSDVSDMKKILGYDPNLLCDPYSPQSVRNAIRYLLKLDSVQLGLIAAENKKIAKSKFEREAIISEYLQLFENS